MLEATSGHSLNKEPKRDRDNKLVAQAATKTTIDIFHLGGGRTGFKSGSTNNVSRPMAVL